MDAPEKMLRGIHLRTFSEPLDMYRQGSAIAVLTYVYGTTEVHIRAHLRFIFCPGGALHMYVALRLFNLQLQCALLQFNFTTLFTSSDYTLKISLGNERTENCETTCLPLV